MTHDEIAAAVDRRTRVIAVSHVGYLTGRASRSRAAPRSRGPRGGAPGRRRVARPRRRPGRRHAVRRGRRLLLQVAPGGARRRRLLREPPALARALGRPGSAGTRQSTRTTGGVARTTACERMARASRPGTRRFSRSTSSRAPSGRWIASIPERRRPTCSPWAGPFERAGEARSHRAHARGPRGARRQHRVRDGSVPGGRAGSPGVGRAGVGRRQRIRLSTHVYNDEADVARALAVLGDLTARGAV